MAIHPRTSGIGRKELPFVPTLAGLSCSAKPAWCNIRFRTQRTTRWESPCTTQLSGSMTLWRSKSHRSTQTRNQNHPISLSRALPRIIVRRKQRRPRRHYPPGHPGDFIFLLSCPISVMPIPSTAIGFHGRDIKTTGSRGESINMS